MKLDAEKTFDKIKTHSWLKKEENLLTNTDRSLSKKHAKKTRKSPSINVGSSPLELEYEIMSIIITSSQYCIGCSSQYNKTRQRNKITKIKKQ